MNEDPHWVTKAEAMRALEVSLSTLDRMIRKGEVEVRREGRRVYVRMPGRSYLSEAELLRRATARLDESHQEALRLKRTISALERERDEARDAYAKREDTWLKETAAHERMRRRPSSSVSSSSFCSACLSSACSCWTEGKENGCREYEQER